jgi:hypothetical protein
VRHHERITIFSISPEWGLGNAAGLERRLGELFADDRTIRETQIKVYSDDPDGRDMHERLATGALTDDIIIAEASVFRFLVENGMLLRLHLIENAGYMQDTFANIGDYDLFEYIYGEGEENEIKLNYGFRLRADAFFLHRAFDDGFYYIDSPHADYYIGIIGRNLSNRNGGGNKGTFNARRQSNNNTQAFDALEYILQNA